MSKYQFKYMVILRPGVSIAADKFVRVIDLEHPDPAEAVTKALAQMDRDETHLWQSNAAEIRVERVA